MVLKRGLLVLVSCSLVLWFSARHPTWGSACLILVSPDFAPSAMCEMIKIMQEYGEVTCCLGSSANLRNSCLFLQSDIRSGRHPRAGGWPLPPGDFRLRLAWGWGHIL